MSRISWHGDRAKRAAARGLEDGLLAGAEHVLEESRRIVPIEEAILEGSGFADVDGDEASVSYDTPYAVRQHEDLSLGHDAGRSGKYLEKPLASERDVVGRLVQREIARRLEGGLL